MPGTIKREPENCCGGMDPSSSLALGVMAVRCFLPDAVRRVPLLALSAIGGVYLAARDATDVMVNLTGRNVLCAFRKRAND